MTIPSIPTVAGTLAVPATVLERPALTLAALQRAAEAPPARGAFPSGVIHPLASDTIATPQFASDPLVALVQFIFQQPPWLMWGGVVAGGLIAAILAWIAWGQREAITTWFRTRPSGSLAALGILAVGSLGVAGFAGYHSYDFMMNDARFCQGCHIFVPSGTAMERPDTGWYTLVNKLEGKHDTINCHSCHAFNPVAETVKMVFWMSGHREEEIPEHGKVPRQVCEGCHVTGDAANSWQAVARTAGHRIHLASDSAALKDVECLTCHARSAHRFQPADSTCAQQGCHLTDEIKINLGRMATQTDLHCNACHGFVVDVPRLADRDSARATLVPGQRQCFGCHAMRERLVLFDPAKDPHRGRCGDCHNPHSQETPEAAFQTCASSGCHDNYRQNAFHVGRAHVRVVQNCAACHDAHAARVDASDCIACHERARGSATGKARLRLPPLPFDTTEAVRKARVSAAPDVDEARTRAVLEQLREPRPPRGKGDVPPPDPEPPAGVAPSSLPLRSAADSFAHRQHEKLACITCHPVTSRTSRLNFVAPRGCHACHHQNPNSLDCASCHRSADLGPTTYPTAVVIQIAKREVAPRTRTVAFRHETHAEQRCIDCHVGPVTLALKPAAAQCTACHAEHHAEGRDCASCHRTEAIVSAHRRPVDAHVECAACHAAETVAALAPTRSFCLTCHAPEVDHYQPRECTACHLLATPGEHRTRLVRGWREVAP